MIRVPLKSNLQLTISLEDPVVHVVGNSSFVALALPLSVVAGFLPSVVEIDYLAQRFLLHLQG